MARLRGVLDLQALPAKQVQRVRHGGRRGEDARAVLLLQALQEHLHVQQAQEAAQERSQVVSACTVKTSLGAR